VPGADPRRTRARHPNSLSGPLRASPLAEGESPRVAVVIQHVPPRAHLLPRLTAALGDGWHSLTVTEDTGDENPWTTYRACLESACPSAQRASTHPPTHACELSVIPLSATHVLVVQDDALPVPRFGELAREAIRRQPADVVCFYTPEHPAYMGRAIIAAASPGGGFARLENGMFCPLVCTAWPVADAQDILGWWEAEPDGTRHRRCDDAQVARWLRRRKRWALGTAPCLADHDEETPSTLGLGRYRRHAALL
jgi:hypothetical protein